jgi:hypothetical protein
MSLTFSQRMGMKPEKKDLQIDDIDFELRTGLWNLIKVSIIDDLIDERDFGSFCALLWHKHYKLAVDTIPDYDNQRVGFIRSRFFNYEWNEVYDFLEFTITANIGDHTKEKFVERINNLLESEFSGYRLINALVVPISNPVEVEEINMTLNKIAYFTSLNGANIHLTEALNMISNKTNPDYRNSIKESISAVETVCRVLTGESTLGKALKAFENKGIILDVQIKSGFEKIYAYSNSQEGIRHAIIDNNSSPDFHDAKYMLVSCSAFINFLIGKCTRLGISLN